MTRRGAVSNLLVPHLTADHGREPSGLTDLAVAIVNYNTRDLLRACLEEVVAQRPAEIVVVDNASTDGSAAMVQEVFPDIRAYSFEENVGFGAAANLAIAMCHAPYVLLLNSDTVLRRGALAGLHDFLLARPRVGLVGPRLEHVDGSLQRSCFPFPTPGQKFLELSGLDRVLCRIPLLRDFHPRAWSHDHERRVPWVLGAAMLVRRAAFEEVQGFDTSYFMYYEETDLCWRLNAADWQVCYTPVAAIAHIGGASTSQQGQAMALELFRGLARFYRRHYPMGQLRLLQAVILSTMAAKISRDRVRSWFVRDPQRRASLHGAATTWRLVIAEVWRWDTQKGRKT